MEATLEANNLDSQTTIISKNGILNFTDEYALFLKKYLFRLLGSAQEIVLAPVGLRTREKSPAIIKENGKILFSANKERYFSISEDDLPFADEDSIALANNVIEAFFICAEFQYSNGTERHNHYRNENAREQAYKLAIQDGINQWIFGNSKSETRSKFFSLLEKWSVKTYEGKHVTLGFLVNPSSNTRETVLSFDELLCFLNDDSSAVLSDCIHSVLEIDKDCNLIGYHSITEDLATLPSCDLNEKVPIRFVQTVQQFLPKKRGKAGSDKIGVFLLNNGDILLIKNGSTRFVKRNLQWLNLSEPAFVNALRTKFNLTTQTNPTYDKILGSVYASVLDVSFSHTGGIIAIIRPGSIDELMKEEVLSPFDNLHISEDDIVRLTLQTKLPSNEKIVRNKLLKQLTMGNNFQELDRKLRCELIALDGACIIDALQGTIYSFGAIIQNDSGSATGGRSAAAKKLSRYGAAIKISTDGYIDVFVNEMLVYSIK